MQLIAITGMLRHANAYHREHREYTEDTESSNEVIACQRELSFVGWLPELRQCRNNTKSSVPEGSVYAPVCEASFSSVVKAENLEMTFA